MSEATALPTELPPLPYSFTTLQFRKFASSRVFIKSVSLDQDVNCPSVEPTNQS